jgi:hypothetical protein
MRARVPSSRRAAAAAALLIVAGTVVLGLPSPVHSAAVRAPIHVSSKGATTAAIPNAWNNGAIALAFPTPGPSFTVSALSNQTLMAAQSLTGLAEVNATDTIVSTASFSSRNVTWSFASNAVAQGTAVVLTAAVPVRPASGEWESGDDGPDSSSTIGVANVTITFELNSSTQGNPWSLSYSLNVTGWPWLHTVDQVGVEARSNTTLPSTYWTPVGSNRLDERSRVSDQTIASFVWGASARAHYPNGSGEDSSVGSYRNLSSGGSAYLVRLEFVSVTGGYSSLSYDPWLSLVPPGGSPSRLTAWVLTPASIAVVGGAAIGTVALGVVARSRRLPPETDL